MRLKAIIFDWSGTTVDFGSKCQQGAIQAAFQSEGVVVTDSHLHQCQNVAPSNDLRAILDLPEVATQWQATHGRLPNDQDVLLLSQRTEHQLLDLLPQAASPTPWLVQILEHIQKRGLKIGSSSDHPAKIMERLVPLAAEKGFAPDFWVATDQVPQGRPWPWMFFKNLKHLQICPPALTVNVGDTIADVEEANNAGAWSVAVLESSRLVGRSQKELEALSAKNRKLILQQVSHQLAQAGAHLVIKNLSELPAALDQIEKRLLNGLLPPQLARNRKVEL